MRLYILGHPKFWWGDIAQFDVLEIAAADERFFFLDRRDSSHSVSAYLGVFEDMLLKRHAHLMSIASEWTVRPFFRSPASVTFLPAGASPPNSALMV
jgi:hypothetical protein